MNERPILFSAPMVRAILAGTKTQTRRAVKPQFAADAEPEEMCATTSEGWQSAGHSGRWWCASEGNDQKAIRCPYGQPGDRLWVREAFSGPDCMEASDEYPAMPPGQWPVESPIWYWADGDPTRGDWTRPRPSIHMPRWASRITLEITGLRVERLQDISEADALAEGVDEWSLGAMSYDGHCHYAPDDKFRLLWESISGTDSWCANPWVWVVEFKRLATEAALKGDV